MKTCKIRGLITDSKASFVVMVVEKKREEIRADISVGEHLRFRELFDKISSGGIAIINPFQIILGSELMNPIKGKKSVMLRIIIFMTISHVLLSCIYTSVNFVEFRKKTKR